MAEPMKYDDMFVTKVNTVKDVKADLFIKHFAEHLKRQGKFELPKWADTVKTGVHKELAPYSADWLYIRAASIVRRLYIRGGVGVGGFKKIYGGQYRRGTCTNTFQLASGKLLRYILQQLEEIGLIEANPAGGRRITQEGQRELDTIAVTAVQVDEDDE